MTRPGIGWTSTYLLCILLTISIIILSSTLTLGQQFSFNSLTSDDGLAHNSVFSIAEDHKGFMWFGTRDGLSRYDSQRIKNYYFNVDSPNAESNRVTCIYTIGKNLWVGTELGLFRYVFEKSSFQQIRLSKEPRYVYDIKRVSTGELWVSTQDGIYRIGKQGQIRHILPGQTIRSILEFRRGTYLVLHGSDPRLINAEGETVISLSIHDGGQEKLASFRNYTVYKDRQGVVWLGTNGGLLQLDEKTMVFRPTDWLDKLIKPKIRVVRTITEDHEGNMWVGSESGILVTVDKGENNTQIQNNEMIKQ